MNERNTVVLSCGKKSLQQYEYHIIPTLHACGTALYVGARTHILPRWSGLLSLADAAIVSYFEHIEFPEGLTYNLYRVDEQTAGAMP